MSTTVTSRERGDLLVQILSLPERDRAAIAQELLDSLPEDYDWAAHMNP